jgi:hypothetical protein
MKNVDIARETFDPRRNYSSVIKQQGRVELEADWNEHAAITLHLLRTTMADLIGPYGGPQDDSGFEVLPAGAPQAGLDPHTQQLLDECENGDFVIRGGRYYVDGVLCECRHPFRYAHQPGLPPLLEPSARFVYLAYLDVWEREITALQDERLREVALGDADSSARTQVCWMVRTTPLTKDSGKNTSPSNLSPSWPVLVEGFQPAHASALKARTRPAEAFPQSEAGDSEAGNYRGLENQLYRVEIHRGGEAPTFKWSRENGSVAFAVERIACTGASVVATLATLPRDDASALQVGNWVEFDALGGLDGDLAGELLEVKRVDIANRDVHLERAPGAARPADPLEIESTARNPIVLRRWDQGADPGRRHAARLVEGAVPVEEGQWITLELGIQVWFEPSSRQAHLYRSGDYWLIPARVATADVDWPRHDGHPVARPPQGVRHHYAPLALIDVTDAKTTVAAPLTRQFGYAFLTGFGRMVLTRDPD